MNNNQFPGMIEGPPSSDMDRFINAEDMDTEQQTESNERVGNQLQSTTDAGVDEYWADFDIPHAPIEDAQKDQDQAVPMTDDEDEWMVDLQRTKRS